MFGLNNFFFFFCYKPSQTPAAQSILKSPTRTETQTTSTSTAMQSKVSPPPCLCPTIIIKKKKIGGRRERVIVMVWYIFSFCSRDQHEGSTGPADRRHLQARPHWRRAVGGDEGQAVRATLPSSPPPEPAPPVSAAESSQPRKRPRCSQTSPQLQHNFARVSAPFSSLFDCIYICNLLLIKNPCAHTSCL